MKQSSKRLLYPVIAALMLAGAGFATWHGLYPYGRRCCVLKILYVALQNYAQDHGGKFPDSESGPLEALRKLYPDYINGTELAGLSGDPDLVLEQLKHNLPLSKESTSLVYVPGLEAADDGGIALLWESRPGLLPDGRRSFDEGHVVMLNHQAHKLIPNSGWDSFLNKQAALQKQAHEKHRQQASSIKPKD